MGVKGGRKADGGPVAPGAKEGRLVLGVTFLTSREQCGGRGNVRGQSPECRPNMVVRKGALAQKGLPEWVFSLLRGLIPEMKTCFI